LAKHNSRIRVALTPFDPSGASRGNPIGRHPGGMLAHGMEDPGRYPEPL
jgi:hypothetical protein